MAPTPPVAAPPASPIPGTGYASAAATANAAYQQALAQINGQRQQAMQSFGYRGTIDPTTGQLTDMQVDPNNPYGQYQQMLGQGATDQAGVRSAAAARGLGSVTGARGGGLAAQDLAAAKLAFGGQSAALGQNLMSTLSGLTTQQNDAQNTMNNALWQAEQDAASKAIQDQAFNPADFSGITDQPANGGAVPAPKTYTTDIGPAASPKSTLAPSKQGRGVKYRPNEPTRNAFQRALRDTQTRSRTRGRRRR